MDNHNKERLKTIKLTGIKTHGLKDISLEIPHDQITVITGLSGSGKSSLAIDTLFAEGQRRYLESLSSYVRQFLNKFEKPEFDKITGLRPAIAIEQKTQGYNPRSTVGTVTEIYDYLRVLFARIGTPFSPHTNEELKAYSASDITQKFYDLWQEDPANKEFEMLAPIAQNKKGSFRLELEKLQKEGFSYAIIDDIKYNLDEIPELDKNKFHNIDLIIGSFSLELSERYEIETACMNAQKYGTGIVIAKYAHTIRHFSASATCPISGFSISELTPRLFSFNNPVGACKTCFGLGSLYQEESISIPCRTCHGVRLNAQALCVKINGLNIAQITQLSLNESFDWMNNLKLNETQSLIAGPLVIETTKRLGFLLNVGLDYLTLERSAQTLSGGESQRIRLASQIGSELEGVLYILDEPSIGLHPKDNIKLINTLKKLRDLGNTIVMVEHDEETMRASDYIVEMGPKAGVHGGQVVFSGSIDELTSTDTITAQYLSGKKKIHAPTKTIDFESCEKLTISDAKMNNLKNISVSIPLNCMVGICGVSGSGKSTLIMEELTKALQHELAQQKYKYKHDLEEDYEDESICKLEGVIQPFEIIDQSPIGRTPRSTPSTYTNLMAYIRDWYAKLPESRARGYTASRFSFNVDGGRCKLCNGEGTRHIEMHFLPDIQIQCESCLGKRYNKETCEILYEGLSIADVLDLTIEDALGIFHFIPAMKYMLQTLCDVHLGYLKLGQTATTLSGGEAQRLKLGRILGVKKVAHTKTTYILDEPTTGLHFDDVQALLLVLRKLVDSGNNIIMIEHHIDLLKMCDWLIEIGPEGGKSGGQLIAQGTFQDLQKLNTPTGKFF